MILKTRKRLAFGLLAIGSNIGVEGQSATCPKDKTGVEGFIVNDPYYGTKTRDLHTCSYSELPNGCAKAVC